MFGRTLSFVLLFVLGSLARGETYVYISVAAEKRIAVYQLDSATGKLTHKSDCQVADGEPGALTIDPDKRFLLAAIRSTGKLASFRPDAATGKLTHINTVTVGPDPAHISTDRTGRYLLTAYYVAGEVTVHSIAANGSLSVKPKQTVKTKEKAHAIVFNPTGSAVLVPHTGPNTIYAFPWLPKTGELSKGIFRSKFDAPNNTGPRHVVFHPTLELNRGVDLQTQIAYVVNEQGGSVTMYHAILNPINWLLEPKQTLSTVPAGFKGTNACAEIKRHPSNRFLYASNRGHESIAGFRVNKETGELTSLGQTPTEKTPRSFDIDPSGIYWFRGRQKNSIYFIALR